MNKYNFEEEHSYTKLGYVIANDKHEAYEKINVGLAEYYDSFEPEYPVINITSVEKLEEDEDMERFNAEK